MPPASSCNYWVFREGRSTASGDTLRLALVQALRRLSPEAERDAATEALLRAGELETALADQRAEDASPAAVITNAVAAALVQLWAGDVGWASLALVAEQLRVPAELSVSTPEGFAYYALHPLAFAQLVDCLPLPEKPVAVLGIRSIGATLSAVVVAAWARRHVPAQRMTVRPTGHPYDRLTTFTAPELRWIATQRASEAEFYIVDEGPGLSGSSFLSVGDALLQAGVERRRIHFLCSHQPDPDALAAPNAATRWRSFQSHCVSTSIPFVAEDSTFCSGGEWRRRFYEREEEWPASWTQMERVKFLTPTGDRLLKFAGFGRFGTSIAERARLLASSGFGPRFFDLHDGFAEYAVVRGSPCRQTDLDRAVVERIADYCAWRAVEFRTTTRPSPIQEMARFNYEALFAEAAPDGLTLEASGSTVLCDGRMQPHEWIRGEGTLLKTDGESHGDDHFFPGPCDIAWDLAGAIAEWGMDGAAAEALLRRYYARSGDQAQGRIGAYITAYGVFRAAYCGMAAYALRGSAEAERLARDVARYAIAVRRPIWRAPERTTAPEAAGLTGRLCLEPGA